MDEKSSQKQFNVWLDEQDQETLEYLRLRYGSTLSGALRVGLRLLRKHIDDESYKIP